MAQRAILSTGDTQVRVLPAWGDVSLPLTRVGTLPLDRGGGRGVPMLCPAADGVLVNSPGRLSLFRPDLGQELWMTETTAHSRFAVAGEHIIYPDSNKAAVPRIRVLDVATGGDVRVVPGPGGAGLTAISPASDLAIFSHVEAKTLLAWDLARGQLRWSRPFWAVGGACVGTRLYVTPFDPQPFGPRAVLCLDMGSGEELWRFDVPQHGPYSFVLHDNGVTVLPDGDLIAITQDGQHYRLDPMTGAVTAAMVANWEAKEVSSDGLIKLAVTPDAVMHLRDREIVAYRHDTMTETWRLDWKESLHTRFPSRMQRTMSGVHLGRESIVWTHLSSIVAAVAFNQADGVGPVWTEGTVKLAARRCPRRSRSLVIR